MVGAVLSTGFLGGAVATQMRIGGNVFAILFPVLVGALLWRGLLVRDDRLAALLAGGHEGPGRLPDVLHVSISIARPPAEVYAFASDPRNLPRWAAGLARSEVRRDGDAWIADAPFGRVRVKFVERNSLGVIDHDVTLASGVTAHNPMRVVPNGTGSEFVFTLIRRPGMSDADLARDKAAVEHDLRTLKALLERPSRS